ncbi:hypothetical protein F5887DRAFT_953234 [Amanita rubescens]|nr:hypothetical protein F5887DRAFT_953234 [Amanita rubescens]
MATHRHPLIDTTRQANGLEMSWRQRAIVDTCFEEGQYESAISNLEQLQSPSYKPSVSHVQQLIYIALHHISGAAPEKTTKSIYDSPSKLQHFAKTVISSMAVSDARQLLFSLTTMQSPDSLARALPSYESTVNVATNATEDVGDSDIARESLCIKEAKDCWSLLTEGFLSKGKVLFSTPKRKGRRRRGDVDDFTPLDDPVGTSRSIVADSAWPMLDWLLTLFERDERLFELEEHSLYSPLLLAQIPPTRNEAARWDIGTPLAIVMLSLQQVDLLHRRMGARLLTLLTNLSLTPHLSFSMFIASVFGQFSTAAPEHLYFLLSALPPTLQVHQFKVALCYKFIDELNAPERSNLDNRSKPLARARKPRSRREGEEMDTALGTTSTSSSIKHILPCQTILKALEIHIPETMDIELFLRIKSELFISYGTIQNAVSAADKDVEWMDAVQRKTLHRVLEVVFNPGYGEDAVRLGRLCQSIVYSWA